MLADEVFVCVCMTEFQRFCLKGEAHSVLLMSHVFGFDPDIQSGIGPECCDWSNEKGNSILFNL